MLQPVLAFNHFAENRFRKCFQSSRRRLCVVPNTMFIVCRSSTGELKTLAFILNTVLTCTSSAVLLIPRTVYFNMTYAQKFHEFRSGQREGPSLLRISLSQIIHPLQVNRIVCCVIFFAPSCKRIIHFLVIGHVIKNGRRMCIISA